MDARTPDMIWEECLAIGDFTEWVNFIDLHDVSPVHRKRQAPVRAERRPIRKNRRPRDSVKDPRNSYWFREYADPNPEHLAELLDPETPRAKLFRRRFRLPYVVYQEILRYVRDKKWFSEGTDAFKRPCAPLELKMLGYLRVIGRGWAFDDVAEATEISEETHRLFFHKFSRLFSEALFDVWVRGPKDDEELRDWMAEYTEAGFPGCFGSVDGVHILWEKCTSGLKNICKGKETYCTLGFEVVVNHRRWIQSCTKAFYGSHNDKTLSRYDPFIQKLHAQGWLQNSTFEVQTSDGRKKIVRGLYLLSDNGYNKWRCLQCPIKWPSTIKEARYSKWLESMRKDVECTFGILKGRFRILKTGFRVHSPKTIENVMHCCCIFHNMLLKHDGLDERWENGVVDPYGDIEGQHDLSEMNAVFRRLRLMDENLQLNETTDLSRVGPAGEIGQLGEEEDAPEICENHYELREILMENFDFKFQKRGIVWPSRNKVDE